MTQPMAQKATPGWLLLLFAFVAASPLAILGSGGGTSGPALTDDQEASTQTSGPPTGKFGYCEQRFTETFAAAIVGSRTLPANPPRAWPADLAEAATRNEVTPHVFIATIPDPIDSGYAYVFQSQLQAVRLGLEAHVNSKRKGPAEFYRTASWLPWYETLPGQQEESEACRFETPGLVTFRGTNPSDVALLLLVGETPTGGIHSDALMAAFEIAAALTPVTAKIRTGESEPGSAQIRALKLLGPTFSGSVASLQRGLHSSAALHRAPHGFKTTIPWEVSIVSGTATGQNLRETLANLDLPGSGNDWFPAGKVEFWTTTVPEEVMQCRYLAFLCHWLGERGQVEGQDAVTACQEAIGNVERKGKPVRLPGVALLHESGTQFGTELNATSTSPASGRTAPSSCSYLPGFRAAFPANVASLRDAYEAMDKSQDAVHQVARRTSLDVSLRERRAVPGLDGAPSPKAIFARDVALSRTIAALERQRVRHVAIQATDIADAIFLSRKIRDVAPDMRIAIFQADNLLLHPSFRSFLSGALVVTPYPFLGAADLDFERPEESGLNSYDAFENSASQGVFNAALALRGAGTENLREYALRTDSGDDDHLLTPRYSVLPVWIAAVGASRFVPLFVAPNTLNHYREELEKNPVYPGLDAKPAAGTFQLSPQRFAGVPPRPPPSSKTEESKRIIRDAWRVPFERLHARRLGGLSRRKPSQPWGVLTLLACLFFIIDRATQKAARSEFHRERLPSIVTKAKEREVDLTAVRLKWNLYAAIRTGVGALIISYLLFWTSRLELSGPDDLCYVVFGFVGLAYICAAWVQSIRRFRMDLIDFRAARAEETMAPLERKLLPRFISYFVPEATLEDWGVLDPERPISLARVSQNQVRFLGALTTIVMLVLLGVHVCAFIRSSAGVTGVMSAWTSTLLTERTLSLAGSISVASPTLLCAGVFYLWTVSRMAHLRLIHGVSRMTPPDRVADFVSTPIRLILHPSFGQGPDPEEDNAFTLVERTSVNSIVRPMTGPYYVASFLFILLLPAILFSATPIASLERDLHLPLVTMLYLAYVLIACSLLQMFQYWTSLELLLKSIFQHPLGRSFAHVAPFVRESIDEQVSRTPNDLFRLTACVGEYENLQRWAHKPNNSVAQDHRGQLDERAKELSHLRGEALEAIGPHKQMRRSDEEAALGCTLVEAASQLMRIVELERLKEASGIQADGMPPAAYPKSNITWINDAEAFCATVVTILINRHVRQLQYFVYPLLTSTVLLMGAILSYPFEPRRLMMSFVWALVIISALASVWTYIQLDRNSLLSKIAASTPGSITPNAALAFRMLVWGIAPILAALAADYPDLVNAIARLIAPAQMWQ